MNANNITDTARLSLLLNELRLPAIKLLWAQFAERADKEGWPAARFLTAIAEHELAERDRRRIERHLAEARLLPGKTLDTFAFEAVPMISRAQITAIAAGDAWLEKGATGNGNRWTRERVTSMRSSYHIPVFKPADDGIEPWLNLGNAAKLLKIAPKTLRLAAEAGEIEAFHPLSEGPWIFARTSLITTAAQSIAERARQNPRYPTGSHPNQQSL